MWLLYSGLVLILFVASLFGVRSLFLRVDIDTRKSLFLEIPAILYALAILVCVVGAIMILIAGEDTNSLLFKIGTLTFFSPLIITAGIFVSMFVAIPVFMILGLAFIKMLFFCFGLKRDDFTDWTSPYWFDF